MSEVAICTVTHNSAAELPEYFEALQRLPAEELPRQLVLVDCASTDDSVDQVRLLSASLDWPVSLVPLEHNAGFTGGMNAALAALSPDVGLVLSLNPDARLEPGALTRLCRCRDETHSDEFPVGAVAARLVRPKAPDDVARLDACGMRLAPSWRHLDRGSDEPDRGQHAHRLEVFGGTGAGTLFVLEALLDCSLDGTMFDEDFHSYREDAELCFRLRERGWHIVFEPAATIVHRRQNLPRRRTAMSAFVNAHSLKNRYLLRLLHDTGLSLALTAVPATLRELGILAWVLMRERSSLWVYRWLWQNRRRVLARRQRLRRRRCASARDVEAWFWRDSRRLPPAAQ